MKGIQVERNFTQFVVFAEDTILSTPLVACRQHGSAVGFGYAELLLGERLSDSAASLAEDDAPPDFRARNEANQLEWTPTSNGPPPIYARTASLEKLRLRQSSGAVPSQSGVPSTG